MTAPLAIRLRFGDSWIAVIPHDDDTNKFKVEVTDILSRPIGHQERREACKQLLRVLSDLRQQIFFDELDGNAD